MVQKTKYREMVGYMEHVNTPVTYLSEMSLVTIWSIRDDELWLQRVGLVMICKQPREKSEFT